MQQLEYQTKTKDLTDLSWELLGSLVVLEDDYFLKQIWYYVALAQTNQTS